MLQRLLPAGRGGRLAHVPPGCRSLSCCCHGDGRACNPDTGSGPRPAGIDLASPRATGRLAMEIEIHGIPGDPALQAHVRSQLTRAIERLPAPPTTVEVGFTDENGPKS